MNDWIRNTDDYDLRYQLRDHVGKLESNDVSNQQKTVLLHEFYTKFTADGVQGLEKVANDYQQELIRDYEDYLEDVFEPRLEKLFKKYDRDLNSLRKVQE